jgi:FtsH-binding integral membrane protein
MRPQPNRLTIAHLLLWMAGTALAIVIFPTDWLPSPAATGTRAAFLRRLALRDNVEKVLAAIIAPLYGTAIAGLPLAALRLVERRSGFPAQPGHFLLLALGLLYLLGALVLRAPADAIYPPTSLLVFMLLVALVAVSLGAAVQIKTPAGWCLTFRTVLGVTTFLVLGYIAAHWDPRPVWAAGLLATSLIVASLAGLFAVTSDLWQRQSEYDLFHWLGVVVFLGTLALPLLVYGAKLLV